MSHLGFDGNRVSQTPPGRRVALQRLEPVAGGRQAWAERIREAYGRTVEAVFQVGRELLQAKQELPHGEFMTMIERELPFSQNTANCFMAVASAAQFQNPSIAGILPCSWYTLYVLQRLDQATFDAAVQAGKIHPEMTRAEAEALLPAKHVAPVVPMSDAMRESMNAAMAEGGRMIAEFVKRDLEAKRLSDTLDQRIPPAPRSIAAESLALDALRRLRCLHALLRTESPKPQFDHRWAEAHRLASAIVKQLKALS